MQLSSAAVNRRCVHWDTDPWLSAGPRGELVGRGMQSNFLCVPFLIALIVSCSRQLAAEGLLHLHDWRVYLHPDVGLSSKWNLA